MAGINFGAIKNGKVLFGFILFITIVGVIVFAINGFQRESELQQKIVTLQEQVAANDVLLDTYEAKVKEEEERNEALMDENERLKAQNISDKLEYTKEVSGLKAKHQAERNQLLNDINQIKHEN